VLLDVDDMLFSADPVERQRFQSHLRSKYQFGKWVYDEGDFIGRRLKHLGDRVLVDQEKYILENIRPDDLVASHVLL
jgi:hypothetical protein